MSPFVEFHAELEADYPAAFADAAYLLRRLAAGERLFPATGARRAALRLTVPARAAMQAWRRLLDPAPLPEADALVLDVPGRSDYFPLLSPIAAELSRRGNRVARLSPREGWHRAAPGALRRARARYALLQRHEESFARRWELTPHARRELATVLRCLAWDAELTRNALAISKARVGLAIHTKLDPGVLTAFRESGTPLLLMQHGVFSGAWSEHDFLGASELLAWGPYFSQELAAFRGPKPPSVVVGSPRLERLLAERAVARQAGTVVYFGTNYDEAVDRRAVRLAAESLKGPLADLALYRPHPSEDMAKYRDLIVEGLIRASQVVTDRSSYELMPGASLVLGSQTTLLLEAAAIGVPAAQVLPEDVPVDWAERGLPHASSAPELGELVGAAVSSARAAAELVAAAAPLARSMFREPRGAAMRSARAVEYAMTGAGGAQQQARAGVEA